jgi:hypothetical protein
MQYITEGVRTTLAKCGPDSGRLQTPSPSVMPGPCVAWVCASHARPSDQSLSSKNLLSRNLLSRSRTSSNDMLHDILIKIACQLCFFKVLTEQNLDNANMFLSQMQARSFAYAPLRQPWPPSPRERYGLPSSLGASGA